MNTNKRVFTRLSLGFSILWTFSGLASILLAWGISFGLVLLARSIVGDYVVVNGVRHITEDYLFSWMFFPLIGLLQGGIQALILREVHPRPGMWALVTPAGWIAGFVILRAVSEWFIAKRTFPEPPWFYLLTVFLTLGLCISLAQWLVLRRWAARAGWWVLFSTLGWVILPLFSGESFTSVLELLLIGLLPSVFCLPAFWLMFDRRHGGQAEALP
ncbi:hypothetical protein [Anaerolinea sp.]|uniref:hypothetical protein n=1 Tax=Anaerolinea sp. TaxID=1872519 RepID=UPI002ACD53E4|nr:hypothetical protein [Anaerolinea sp.]